MKFFRVGLLVAIVAALMIAPALTTRAQDNTQCWPGLSAEDCALYTEAQANMASVKSFNADYTVTLNGGDAANKMDLNIKGSLAADTSKVMTDVSAENAMAALKDLVLSNTTEGSFASGSDSSKFKFELRIVDGVIYFTDPSSSSGAWMKADLQQLLDMATQQAGGMGLPGMGGGKAGSNPLSPELSAKIMGLFKDPSEVMNATVTDGPEVDGVATKQFTVSVNLKAIVTKLLSDEGVSILKELLSAQGQEMSDKDLAQAQAMVRMFEPVLDATKLEMSTFVDPAAKQVRGINLAFSTVIDAQTAAMLNSSGSGTPSEVKLDFVLDVKLTKLNEAVTVEPAADAVDILQGQGAGASK